jgi:hypothetical protein
MARWAGLLNQAPLVPKNGQTHPRYAGNISKKYLKEISCIVGIRG